jgi:ABC-type transporter Mla maintaining outer membrane lipid asymmetry ATPase subunit MlaF
MVIEIVSLKSDFKKSYPKTISGGWKHWVR